MKVFITGDRTNAAIYTPLVAVEIMRTVGAQGHTLVTGDNDGVEALVRAFAEQAGLECEVIATPRNAEGKRDWDARHNALNVHGVVAVHVDPHVSSVTKSLVETMSDDALRIVTPADLFA